MQFIIIGAGLFMLLTLIGAFERRPRETEPDDYESVKDEVLRLRERVRTLEKIVTDPDDRLSRDFRNL